MSTSMSSRTPIPRIDSLTSTSASLRGMDAVPRSGERTPLLDVESALSSGTATPPYGVAQESPLVVRTKPRRSIFVKRARYYVPSLAWIPNYSSSFLAGDFLSGVSVASILIPISVSYATSLAKLSPVTGLFSASIPGLIYAIFGSSRHLNVAPEASLSLLIGQAVTEFKRDLPDSHSKEADMIGLAVSTVITLQAGLFTFLLGFFRLGFIDVVLSRALLRGFVTAVAVIIMIEQLIPMFGLVELQHVFDPETTIQKIEFLLKNVFTHAHRMTTIISFVALFSLVLFRLFKDLFKSKWWIYRLPEVLIIVVASTVLSANYRWDKDGVDILGAVHVKTSRSFLQFPVNGSNFKYIHGTTPTAILIAIIGFLDSIVAAKQNGARFGYSISPNRELVALGASNIFGSFIQGTLPAYGSITRTRINADIGARSQMSSVVCSTVVLLATFFLLPFLYYLPKCVLGAIICLIVFSLLAEVPHDLVYYWRMGAWVDLALMFLTFAFSIVWNVEVGIVSSLIISLLMVVRRSSKARMNILGRIPGTDTWIPISENPEAEESLAGVLIIRIRENLDFANTAQLKERLRRMELYGPQKSHPSEEPSRRAASVLVFHMADVDTCDASAVQIFSELLDEYRSRGVGLFMTHLRSGVYKTFEKAGIVEMIGHDAVQHNVADAIAIIEAR